MVVLILFKLLSQQVTERHKLSTISQQGAHAAEGFYGTQEHIISSFGDSVKEMTVFLMVGPLKCKRAHLKQAIKNVMENSQEEKFGKYLYSTFN